MSCPAICGRLLAHFTRRPSSSAIGATCSRTSCLHCPTVDDFWGTLPEFFRWLAGIEVPRVLPAIPIEADATVLHGPAGSIRIPGRSTPFIEVIRFAAANHLCVELDYRDEQGNRRTRPIEPYSLRRTRDATYPVRHQS